MSSLDKPPSFSKQSFSKQQRLLKPKQFKCVYQSKQWGGSAHYTFNVFAKKETREGNNARLGVTVAKKVSKLAVQRNQIKRQVREFYRTHQQDLKFVDLVITAKPSCLHASTEQRLESIELLWSKILKWQRWSDKNGCFNHG